MEASAYEAHQTAPGSAAHPEGTSGSSLYLDPEPESGDEASRQQQPAPEAAAAAKSQLTMAEVIKMNINPLEQLQQSPRCASEGGVGSSPSSPAPASCSSKQLAILHHRDNILQLLHTHRVVCIEGETGCGKSTKIPQFILDEALNASPPRNCKILITQPRRIAAIKLAETVARERGERVGRSIGFSIGGEKQRSPRTAVTYCTTGYLLQLLVHNPCSIQHYTHVILDEIHERSTETDFALLVVRRLVAEAPRTTVILMSATMQRELLVGYFRKKFDSIDVSPPYHVGAKRFPVQTYFIEELPDMVQRKTSFWSPSQLESGEALPVLCRRWPHKTLRNAMRIKPAISVEAMGICTSVILTQADLGESVLVFLPGITEIACYHDQLTFALSEKKLEKHYIIFILHSQVPFEDQKQVFRPPAPDTIHVILATNIAESSITLPKLTLMVNFCVCRRLSYDTRRRINCLVSVWCSRASCEQRAGRVGRVGPGIAVHLVSRRFFEVVFQEHDPPHILSAPLAKLVLHAKDIGSRMGIPSPSEFLSQAVQPPSLEQMHAALQDLADLGAITSSQQHSHIPELAEITLLGRVCLALPVDLELCRLVLYGVLCGVSVDSIVMAAGASLSQDVFKVPCRLIMKNDITFRNSLSRSLQSRIAFDCGQYSESLMMCNVFHTWLTFKAAHRRRGGHLSNHKLVAAFCHMHSLRWEQLLLFESTVAEITLRLLHLIPADSASHVQLQDLLAVTTGHHNHTDTATPQVKFCKDPFLLKAVLTGAFSHQLLYGERSIDNSMLLSAKERSFQLLNIVEESRMSQHLALILPGMIKAQLPHLGQALETVLPGKACYYTVVNGVGVVQFTQPPNSREPQPIIDPAFKNISRNPQKTAVEECESWEVFYNEQSVVRLKLPFDAMLFWQFCERNPTWRVEGIPVEFPRPSHPLRTLWWRVAHNSSDGIYSGTWRNPSGFVCELHEQSGPLLALATMIQGSEQAKSVSVRGVTVLPNLLDGPVALLMVLAFQSQHVPLKLMVNEEDHIIGFKLGKTSQEVVCQQNHFIAADDLLRVNALRSALSLALSFYSPDGELPMADAENIAALLRHVIQRTPLSENPSPAPPPPPPPSSKQSPRVLSKILSLEDAYPHNKDLSDKSVCDSESEEESFLQEFEFPTLAEFVYFPPLQSSLLAAKERRQCKVEGGGEPVTASEKEQSSEDRKSENEEIALKDVANSAVCGTQSSEIASGAGDSEPHQLTGTRATQPAPSFELSPHAPAFLPTRVKQESVSASETSPSHGDVDCAASQAATEHPPFKWGVQLPPGRASARTRQARNRARLRAAAMSTHQPPPSRASLSHLLDHTGRSRGSPPYLDPVNNPHPSFLQLYPSHGPLSSPVNTYHHQHPAPMQPGYMQRYTHPRWVARLYRNPSLPLNCHHQVVYPALATSVKQPPAPSVLPQHLQPLPQPAASKQPLDSLTKPSHSSPSPEPSGSEEPRQSASEQSRESSLSLDLCPTKEPEGDMLEEMERMATPLPKRKAVPTSRALHEAVVKFFCSYLSTKRNHSCKLNELCKVYRKTHKSEKFWLEKSALKHCPEFIFTSKSIRLNPAFANPSKSFKPPLECAHDTENTSNDSATLKDVERTDRALQKSSDEGSKENERPASNCKDATSTQHKEIPSARRENLSKMESNVLRVLCQLGKKAFLSQLLQDSKLNKLCWEIGASLSEQYFASRPHLFKVESGLSLEVPVEDSIISLSSDAALPLALSESCEAGGRKGSSQRKRQQHRKKASRHSRMRRSSSGHKH